MNRRNTHQKQEVLNAIQGENLHLRAEEVLERVQELDPAIGRATVYRNLQLLCDEGVIQKIAGDGFSWFDGNGKPHDHIRCVCCGRIEDAPSYLSADAERQVEEKTGMQVLSHSVTYNGICCSCKNKKERGN